MNRSTRVLVIIGLGICAGGFAHARSMGAFAGHPLDQSPPICFKENMGGVTGNGSAQCSGHPFPSSPRWEVPLPIEGHGQATVQFAARGDGLTGPSCSLYAISQNNGVVLTTGRVTRGAATYGLLTLVVQTIPDKAFLYLACDTLRTTDQRVGSINWTMCPIPDLCGQSCLACLDGTCQCNHVSACTSSGQPLCTGASCVQHGGVDNGTECEIVQ